MNSRRQSDEIVPRSRDVELKSRLSDRDMKMEEEQERLNRRGSNAFVRLMSMGTFQAMSSRNLLMNNAVYRERVCGIFVNFVARVFTLSMNIILFLLSVAYCTAQLSTVTLKVLNECTPKTLEEIYHHSYLAGLQDNGSVIINAESQWGWTKEACWTTNKFELDTDRLWYSNVYEHEWTGNIDHKVILFGMISVYSFCILMYNLRTIYMDVSHLRKNTLHTLSNKHQTNKIRQWISQMLQEDNTRWIIKTLLIEVVDFTSAILSMMLYNGYSWMDPGSEEDVYLAERPRFIVLYASVIAFNMIGFGFLWCGYAFAPSKIYGLTFEVLMFLIDDLSDLFYTVFPILVVYSDDYTANKNLSALMGQLNLDRPMQFVSAFGFLLLLCSKSLYLVYSTTNELRDRYYLEFGHGEGRYSWIDVSDQTKKWKQTFLSVLSCLYIAGGVLVLSLVSDHINSAVSHCDSVQESNFIVDGIFKENLDLTAEQKLTLEINPELFLWDHCLYKVYPFISEEQHRCHCRVFVIDWSDLESTKAQRDKLHLNQTALLSSLLVNSEMLEKLSCRGYGGDEDVENPLIFDATMFPAVHMKAFEWKLLSMIDLDKHIGVWKHLELLKLESLEAERYVFKFEDFKKLSEMQYFSFEYTLSSLDREFMGTIVDLEPLCAMRELQVLNFQSSTSIHQLPQCFANFQSLRILDYSGGLLFYVPLAIFELPKLTMLSLFRSSISYDGLIRFNAPPELDLEDERKVTEWVDDHFSFNEDTEYNFQLTPLCDSFMKQDIEFPSKMKRWLQDACDLPWENFQTWACLPHQVADGKCNQGCNYPLAHFDGGDCIQTCFVEDLTQCLWSDLLNEKCDASCDNAYCSSYVAGSVFAHEVQVEERDGVWYGADFFQCPNVDFVGDTNVEVHCEPSQDVNTHFDPSIPQGQQVQCVSEWIGDQLCDDSCSGQECSFDLGDCAECGQAWCYGMSFMWGIVDPFSSFNVEIEAFCSRSYPLLVDMMSSVDDAMGTAPLPGNHECLEVFSLRDQLSNDDGYLNVKEFVTLWTWFGNRKDATATFNVSNREAQVNCSLCFGVPNWNLHMDP